MSNDSERYGIAHDGEEVRLRTNLGYTPSTSEEEAGVGRGVHITPNPGWNNSIGANLDRKRLAEAVEAAQRGELPNGLDVNSLIDMARRNGYPLGMGTLSRALSLFGKGSKQKVNTQPDYTLTQDELQRLGYEIVTKDLESGVNYKGLRNPGRRKN